MHNKSSLLQELCETHTDAEYTKCRALRVKAGGTYTENYVTRFDFRQVQEIFIFSETSRSIVAPTQSAGNVGNFLAGKKAGE